MNLDSPQELHDIVLRLEYEKMRDVPEDLLLSLHYYTRGYRHFIELIGMQIEPNLQSVFQLEYVERGSIKLKNKVGYKSSITNFIALLLTKLLLTDGNDDNLEDKAELIENETNGFISENCDDDLIGSREAYIDRVGLAEIMNDISEGAKLLRDKEFFEVVESDSKVIKFDPKFRSHISISDLKKSKPKPFDGIEKIIVLKPCNVGDSAWFVESIQTQRKFYVKIADSEWLRKYQSGNMPVVRANDIITVNLQCEIVKNKCGNSRNVNAVITKVHKIEQGSYFTPDDQVDLF